MVKKDIVCPMCEGKLTKGKLFLDTASIGSLFPSLTSTGTVYWTDKNMKKKWYSLMNRKLCFARNASL